MFWEEDQTQQQPSLTSHEVVDLAFSIRCRALPVDHAFALGQAIEHALPWLREEEGGGVHLIHVAASSHGWQRPQHGGAQLLHPSRRTKLILRLPAARIADAQALEGQRLSIEGHLLEVVGAGTVRPLRATQTLFSRFVAAEAGEEEQQFLNRVAKQLQELGARVRKLMCGKSHALKTSHGELATRSLMIADLSPEDSVKLQEKGLGPGRLMGCGLFVPHKGIRPVREED